VDVIPSLEQISYEEAKIKKAKMIKKMLWIGYQMGYDAARTPAERAMDKKRLCWNHVQLWCMSKHCKIRKSLKSYKLEELTQVLTQFEEVYKSFEEQYKKAG
jgi:hypothetical protein